MVVTAARRKVEKTVSITPGTHQRIIYPRRVNCDLRSVMICNNFLSLLSVSRQGRSPRAGGGVYGRENQNVNAMRGDAVCNVGGGVGGSYNQFNYRCVGVCVWVETLQGSRDFTVDYTAETSGFLLFISSEKWAPIPQWEPCLAIRRRILN